MTSLDELLAELSRLDVRLVLDGDKLRVDAPRGALTPELHAALVERKAEVVARLRAAGTVVRGVSPGQRRLWELAKLQADGAAYIVPTAFRLRGPLDAGALAAAFADVERRHEPLRTLFREVDGVPVPEVQPPGPLTLPIDDLAPALAGADEHARDQAVRAAIRDATRAPFDLAADRPWRATLLRLGDDDHVLALAMHHIAFDGRSKPIFLRELGLAYRARAAGREPAFEPLAAGYAEFAAWQRAAAADAERAGLERCRARLEGVEELELPADRPDDDTPSAGARSASFALPAALAASLRSLARQEQSSPYIVLLAAFAALLHRRTGQDDLLLCSPFASRDRAEFEGLVGYLNTIVPLRIDAGGDPAFRDLVARVRTTALEAIPDQQVPLQRLASLPALARVSLARALFSYQDASTRTLELDGIAATPVDVRKPGSDFDLAFYAEGTRDGGIGGILEYDAGRFDDATIERLLADFERMLAAALADPGRRVGSLPASGPGPAQVEAMLGAHRQIDHAIVGRRPGHAGSIAWLVLNENDPPRLDDVRARLRDAFPGYLVPSALVTVDRMPYLSDGTVDRAALPEPPARRTRAETSYVAPRTPLERQLAQAWKRVLWLDAEVGVEDRFADLGGHSLLSAQLVVELERDLGRPLPSSALAAFTTIASMARAIEEDGAKADAPAPAPGAIAPEIVRRIRSFTASWSGERKRPDAFLVGMNTAGTRPPLFWCLQRHQELAQLARYLGPDQPVWGMRSGHNAMEKTPDNVAALAAIYAGEIVEHGPPPRFVVGGNCQAARIAFDIARDLAARGHEPALLILHEKFIPRPYPGAVALMFGTAGDRNPHLQFARPEVGWRKFYGGPVTFDAVTGQHMEFFVEPNIQVLIDAIRRRIDEASRPRAPEAPIRMQRLPPAACRAALAFSAPARLQPGQKFRFDVTVTNTSTVAWEPFDTSGIALAGRWFDAAHRPVAWHDGWSPLPAALGPGASVVMRLDATAPAAPGRYFLATDLVDEGIATFASHGPSGAELAVAVAAGGAPRTPYNPDRPPGSPRA